VARETSSVVQISSIELFLSVNMLEPVPLSRSSSACAACCLGVPSPVLLLAQHCTLPNKITIKLNKRALDVKDQFAASCDSTDLFGDYIG
jgi:hypothetical protein